MTEPNLSSNLAAAVMFIAGGIVADDLRGCVSPWIETSDFAKFFILFIVLYFFTKDLTQAVLLTVILFIMRFILHKCDPNRCKNDNDNCTENRSIMDQASLASSAGKSD